MRIELVDGTDGVAVAIGAEPPTEEVAAVVVAVRHGDALRAVTIMVRRDALLEWTPGTAGIILVDEIRAAIGRAEPHAIRPGAEVV